MSKIKQKLSNLISDMKMWSYSKVIAPILSPLKGSVSYLKNAPILPVIAGALIVAFIVTGLILCLSARKILKSLHCDQSPFALVPVSFN